MVATESVTIIVPVGTSKYFVPLISLLKINRIDLLDNLFGEVLIPQAVFNELT